MSSGKDKIAHIFDIAKANRTPISCTVEVTQKCIFRCPHCFIQGVSYETLSYSQFIDFINQYKKMGGLYLTLTGGECLMHPDFKKMYAYAYNHGLAITVFTNGYLIDDEIICLFSEKPPRKIEISVYGASEKTYYNITKIKDSFNRVINNIDRLIQSNQNVHLKTVVFSENKKDFYDIKRIALERNLQFKYDFKLMPMRDGDNSNLTYQLSAPDIIQLELDDNPNKLIIWKNKLQEKSLSNGLYMFSCGAARYSCFLSSENKLRICASAIFSEIDLNSNSFSSAWQAFEKYTLLPPNKKSKCQECTKAKVCDICPMWGYVMLNSEKNLGEAVDLHCDLANEREMVVLSEKR